MVRRDVSSASPRLRQTIDGAPGGRLGGHRVTPAVAVIALGGTIAMTRTDTGRVTVTMTAEDVIASSASDDLPFRVEAETLAQLPSAHLTIDDILRLASRVEERLSEQVSGVVVVQGTDTMEETAFALDLLVESSRPVVVTGAMRHPDLPGSDGPANLIAALRTAADAASCDSGVLVVMNDQVHAARFVRKVHTSSPAAFVSHPGPLGWLSEGRPRLMLRPTFRLHLPVHPRPGGSRSVPLVTAALGDDGSTLQAIAESGIPGIVIEGLGGGHVAPGPASVLKALANKIPVVLASRTGTGHVLTKTYGFEGSEHDLLGAGLIGSRWLDGPKARMLLSLLLHADVRTPAEVRPYFETILDV